MDATRGLRFPVAAWLALALVVAPFAASARSAGTGLAPATAAAPGKAPGSVRLEPNFRVGETVVLHVDKTTRLDTKGQQASLQHTGFDIRVKVLARGPKGTRLECVYGRKELLEGTDQAIRDNPVLKAVFASNEGLRVVLVAGPHMAQPHVGNVDEVLAAFGKTLDAAVAQMPPEVGAGVQQLSAQLMTRRDAFAAKLIEELLVYFAPVGVTVPLTGVVSGTHDLPPMIGDTPVKTWSSLGVEHYDRAAGRMTLKYRQSSNPDDVRAQAGDVVNSVMKDAAAANAPGAAADAKQEAAQVQTEAERMLATLWVNDVATYDVDMKTGWPSTSHYTHTVQAGDQRVVDDTVVTRVQ